MLRAEKSKSEEQKLISTDEAFNGWLLTVLEQKIIVLDFYNHFCCIESLRLYLTI